jgi:hypothetical protein
MMTYGSKLLHVFRPRGAEHEGLPIRTDLADNFANLWLKAHVEHAIGFVHYKVGNTTKVGLARLQHVDQATRRSNDNFDTTLQVPNLRTLGSTSVHSRVADS